MIQGAAQAQTERGRPRQKVSDLYASVVDTTRRDRLGLAPLQDELRRIDGAQTRTTIVRLVARFQRLPAEVPLRASVGPDEKNPDRYAASLDQDGLGFPQPDYSQKERFADRRTAYQDSIAEIFALAEIPNPNAAAQQAFPLEKQLASIQFSYDGARARDARASDNPCPWTELAENASGIDRDTFAEDTNLMAVDTVVVGQPSFVDGLSDLVREQSIQAWRDYFRWQLLTGFSSYLSTPFAWAHVEFVQGRLRGPEARPPLWRRAGTTANSSLGGLVGRLYVEEHFRTEKKRKIERVVENLQRAFHKEIEALDWVTDSTKAATHRKLRAMTAHVAYPDQWRDFSDLRIEPTNPVGNLTRAAREADRNLVDEGEIPLILPLHHGEKFL